MGYPTIEICNGNKIFFFNQIGAPNYKIFSVPNLDQAVEIIKKGVGSWNFIGGFDIILRNEEQNQSKIETIIKNEAMGKKNFIACLKMTLDKEKILTLQEKKQLTKIIHKLETA